MENKPTISREEYNNFTNAQRSEYLASIYTAKEIARRLDALSGYQMDLYRINEQSFEAQKEEDRVFNSLQVLRAALRIAREKEKENAGPAQQT
jgi:hypothetical protein